MDGPNVADKFLTGPHKQAIASNGFLIIHRTTDRGGGLRGYAEDIKQLRTYLCISRKEKTFEAPQPVKKWGETKDTLTLFPLQTIFE